MIQRYTEKRSEREREMVRISKEERANIREWQLKERQIERN